MLYYRKTLNETSEEDIAVVGPLKEKYAIYMRDLQDLKRV